MSGEKLTPEELPDDEWQPKSTNSFRINHELNPDRRNDTSEPIPPEELPDNPMATPEDLAKRKEQEYTQRILDNLSTPASRKALVEQMMGDVDREVGPQLTLDDFIPMFYFARKQLLQAQRWHVYDPALTELARVTEQDNMMHGQPIQREGYGFGRTSAVAMIVGLPVVHYDNAELGGWAGFPLALECKRAFIVGHAPGVYRVYDLSQAALRKY